MEVGIFSDGFYIMLHSYVMATLCFMLAISHFIRVFMGDDPRQTSKMIKGVVYFLFGVAFVVTEMGDLDVVQVRRILRGTFAMVLVTELAYTLPLVYHVCNDRIRKIEWKTSLSR